MKYNLRWINYHIFLCKILKYKKIFFHHFKPMTKQQNLVRNKILFINNLIFNFFEIEYDCILKKVLKENGKIYLTDKSFFFASKSDKIYIPLTKIKCIKPIIEINQEKDKKVKKYHEIQIHTLTNNIYHFLFTISSCEEISSSHSIKLNESPYDSFILQLKLLISCLNQTNNEIKSNEIDDQEQIEYKIIHDLEKSISSYNILQITNVPLQKLKIIILSIGTRGDVQPYIALGIRLQSEGHQVTIATHQEFQEFVCSYGLHYRMLPGNPRDLMELCVSKGMFTPTFMKMAVNKFIDVMDQLMWVSWQVCQDQDVIIEAPMIRAGVHISEKLKIPHFIAFTMPFSTTKEYCNPFLTIQQSNSSPSSISSSFNLFSYFLIERMFWHPMRSRVNRFREECCDLPPLGLNDGANLTIERKVPFLYCFSSVIVPKPMDWPDWVNISGYWLLNQNNHHSNSSFQPSSELIQFINESNSLKYNYQGCIYVGFGSIVVSEDDVDRLWEIILSGIIESGLRVILSCGWTELNPEKQKLIENNENIFAIGSCPHDWLFPQMKAVCHHGGAGTTATGLYAACPTFIVSFFGDQPFWGNRVSQLGVGSTVSWSELTPQNFASNLLSVSYSDDMKMKAKDIAKKLQNEDGISNAIQHIYRYVGHFNASHS